MVGVYKIVINGLRLTEDTDVAADLFSIAGKLADGIHGIVAADIKEPADVHLLEFLKKLRINRILQGFRKLVTAGAKVSAGVQVRARSCSPGSASWKSRTVPFKNPQCR